MIKLTDYQRKSMLKLVDKTLKEYDYTLNELIKDVALDIQIQHNIIIDVKKSIDLIICNISRYEIDYANVYNCIGENIMEVIL